MEIDLHTPYHTPKDKHQWLNQFMILGRSIKILELESKELEILNERIVQGGWVSVHPLSVFMIADD